MQRSTKISIGNVTIAEFIYYEELHVFMSLMESKQAGLPGAGPVPSLSFISEDGAEAESAGPWWWLVGEGVLATEGASCTAWVVEVVEASSSLLSSSESDGTVLTFRTVELLTADTSEEAFTTHRDTDQVRTSRKVEMNLITWFTCGSLISGWAWGFGRDINWRVTGLIRDHCLDYHLGLEWTRVNVGVSDSQLSGYEGSTSVPKVPVEGDVCITQVFTGVVEGDGESNRPVLNETQVSSHDVIHLVQGDSKWDLIWEHKMKTIMVLAHRTAMNKIHDESELITSDGELSACISQRNEPLLAAIVVDNNIHVVGSQRDVISSNGQWRGWTICYLPVLTWRKQFSVWWVHETPRILRYILYTLKCWINRRVYFINSGFYTST